jgi:anti-sigma regulatory factor (Ser/Thr protein kinase)
MAEARPASRPPPASLAADSPPPLLRPGRREGTVSLRAEPAAVLDLEDFVDGLDFLSTRERYRLKLAGDEILDNLVHHASPLAGGIIVVRAARRRDGVMLAFFFRSELFAPFAERGDEPEPLFDPERRRWRGIGLRMCHNLCADIRMRSGKEIDRIFLRFAQELSPPRFE